MRRSVQVLIGIIVFGLCLHTTLYLRGRLPSWGVLTSSVVSVNTSHERNVTSNPPSLRTITSQPRQSLSEKAVVVGPHYQHRQFLMNQPTACSPSTELVIVVITALDNAQDRQAVRDTWGSYSTNPLHNTSLVFLLGTKADPSLQDKVVSESQRYRDIVQADFVDTYRNLTLKSVALLQWVAEYCNTSRYVLKADDDMYVNVPNLISALRKESLSKDRFVLGHVFTGAKPILSQSSKWYTSKEEFNEKVYPRYTSGTAYSMTTSAAKTLYRVSAEVPLFWLEDIYITGLCSRKAGITVIHNWGFNYQRYNIDGCFFRRAITGHKYTAAEKRTIFKQVYDPNKKC